MAPLSRHGLRWLWPWARDARTPEERDPGLRLVRQMQDQTREELRRLQALHDEADLYLRRERDTHDREEHR